MVSEYQGKKTSQAEVVLSDTVFQGRKDLLGLFVNSFYLSNYEFSKRTNLLQAQGEENKDGDSNAEKDERTKRVAK